MPFLCILATDISGGIAKNNAIPWYIPSDLKLFRTATIDKTVMMGRKTFESLPDNVRPLPHRLNIVVTCEPDKYHSTHHVIYMTADQAREYVDKNKASQVIYMIGGAALHDTLKDRLDGYVLTIVHKSYTCDTIIDLDDIRFFKSKMFKDFDDKEHDGIVFHHELRYTDNALDCVKSEFAFLSDTIDNTYRSN